MRRLARAVVLAAALPLVPVVAAAPAHAAATYQAELRTAVAGLPQVTENRTGYTRSAFKHWIDADGDGCSTRNEVLVAEAVTAPKIGARCALSGGKWVSWYDRRTWTDTGRLDIDHMVPLAEAWDSGASRWTAAHRTAFANDLGDARALVAVTDSVNQSKSDRDPGEWRPAYDQCRYVREWTAVKIRWRLTVDKVEKAALTKVAAGCANVMVTVKRAR
jgi:hypothetical protein